MFFHRVCAHFITLPFLLSVAFQAFAFGTRLALRLGMSNATTNKGVQTMRKLTALILVPFMKVTGFRFSKEYRHAIDGWKLFVFIHVDTVQANLWAGL